MVRRSLKEQLRSERFFMDLRPSHGISKIPMDQSSMHIVWLKKDPVMPEFVQRISVELLRTGVKDIRRVVPHNQIIESRSLNRTLNRHLIIYRYPCWKQRLALKRWAVWREILNSKWSQASFAVPFVTTLKLATSTQLRVMWQALATSWSRKVRPE